MQVLLPDVVIHAIDAAFQIRKIAFNRIRLPVTRNSSTSPGAGQPHPAGLGLRRDRRIAAPESIKLIPIFPFQVCASGRTIGAASVSIWI